MSPSVAHIRAMRNAHHALSMDATEVQQGTGSGFVWSDEGHIVTNAHVVAAGQSFFVSLGDNETFRARIVGVHADSDVAVLRAEGVPKGAGSR